MLVGIAPVATGRILRDLRKKMFIGYDVIDQSDSSYRALSLWLGNRRGHHTELRKLLGELVMSGANVDDP